MPDQDVVGRSSESGVGGPDVAVQCPHQAFSCRHKNLSGVRQPLVPHVERARHVGAHPSARLAQERRSLAQDPFDVVCRPRPFGVEETKCVVEKFSTDLRSATHDGQVLGGEDGARSGSRQVFSGVGHFSIDLGPAPSLRDEFRFNQSGRALLPEFGPHDRPRTAGAHHCFSRRSSERALCPQIDHRFEHAGLSGAVRTRDHRGAYRLGSEDSCLENTKINELYPLQTH